MVTKLVCKRVIDPISGDAMYKQTHVPLTAREEQARIDEEAAEAAYKASPEYEELVMNKECRSSQSNRLLFQINFDQENRLRVLEGKPILTEVQYWDMMKAVWAMLPEK